VTGNVLFIDAESKEMVAGLKDMRVSQIPLAERALDLVRITVAVTHTCDVEISFRAPRSITGEAQCGIQVACRRNGSVDIDARKLLRHGA
jgi:hypothetical protein